MQTSAKITAAFIIIVAIVGGVYYYYIRPGSTIQQTTTGTQQPATSSQSTTTPDAATPASTTPVPAVTPIVAGWQVYQNTTFGFRVDYPAAWTERDSAADNAQAVNFVDPDMQQYVIDNKTALEDHYGSSMDGFYDFNSYFSIHHYLSLKNVHGVDTIDAYIKSDRHWKKIGEVQMDTVTATEAIWDHDKTVHFIMFENKGAYYEIVLNKVNGDSFSDIQRQMLSSFRFLN